MVDGWVVAYPSYILLSPGKGLFISSLVSQLWALDSSAARTFGGAGRFAKAATVVVIIGGGSSSIRRYSCCIISWWRFGPGSGRAGGGGGRSGAAERAGRRGDGAAIIADGIAIACFTLICFTSFPCQVTCALCGEKFDIFWSGDDDEWMCRAATYAIIDGEKKIVHVRCRPVRISHL